MSVSVSDVWAVAQDPETVREALRVARDANARLGEASDAVTHAYVRMSGLMPRVTARGGVTLGRISDERSRLRPVLRRLRDLAGEGVAR